MSRHTSVDDAKMEEKDRVLSHPISLEHIEGAIAKSKGARFKSNPYYHNYKEHQSQYQDWYFGYANASIIIKILYNGYKKTIAK